ncbi:MAG TPA: NUDIX domain-containing protein [Ktedonobacteraceae bacterium]|jgi:ADP-ribose pyrophosphatase YjhB (NUDIX family)|nr:NUDIX domain-containing protein [Ktedonobacteraceae bacterium]
MLYALLKRCVCLFFNTLNWLLGGKLPPFGSAAVVVEENDHYLVVELPGKLTVFPGGFMNWREMPREAAEREGREETGLIVQTDDLISHYPMASQDWGTMSTISFVFHARVIGGKLQNNIEGRPHWLSEQELRTRMKGLSLTILDDYLRYREQQRLLNAKTQILVGVS